MPTFLSGYYYKAVFRVYFLEAIVFLVNPLSTTVFNDINIHQIFLVYDCRAQLVRYPTPVLHTNYNHNHVI